MVLATDAVYDPVPEDEGIPEERPSALLCWPVEWIEHDKPKPKVEGLHCTLAYWPEVEMPKDLMLDGLKREGALINLLRRWELAKVIGVDAFGEDSNYPVLLLEPGSRWSGLQYAHDRTLSKFMGYHKPDTRFTYNPHVSVDLKTALNPPREVVLRPVELWYKDDEPVPV